MNGTKAILFDLYGTLLMFNQRAFLRDITNSLPNPDAKKLQQVLRELLVRSYSTEDSMLQQLFLSVCGSEPDEAKLSLLRDVFAKHRSSVTPFEGAKAILTFLRNRGYKLGLLSNTAQAFKAPLADLKLSELFDVVLFSCDIGIAKPTKEAYLELCRRLNVTEQECLFIGDSQPNDYAGPRAAGMHALPIRPIPNGVPSITTVKELGLRTLDAKAQQLIRPGTSFDFDDKRLSVSAIDLLPDAKQGRYNLVAKARTSGCGELPELYIKRYLKHDSAWLEEAAYYLYRLVGVSPLKATTYSGIEPLLLVTPAPGCPWQNEKIDEPLAQEIGRHCGVAYLFANADLRPRNTFVRRGEETANLCVIDLEHCFFDRALALPASVNPIDARQIDSLSETIDSHTKHRVISAGAIRRTRRAFLAVDDKTNPLVRSFKEGWNAAFQAAKEKAGLISSYLNTRVYLNPALTIGTQSYRRAMCRIDVQDIMARINQDPEAMFAELY